MDNGAAAGDAVSVGRCFSVVPAGLFFRVAAFPSIPCSAVRLSSAGVPIMCADGLSIHFGWSPDPAGGMETQ